MKKQMVSYTTDKLPCIGMDNLSEIFMFCGARERRNFTLVSSETSKIHHSRSEEASLNALTVLVVDRLTKWILPNVSSKKATWEDCMPPIYSGRRRQVGDYIHYQMTHQMKTAGVTDACENESEFAGEVIVQEDDLCARMGSLSTILINICFCDTPYESLICLGEDYSPGVVDECFETELYTLVDIGMCITTGNGTFLPLANVA
jgi:hypothetical protein